jgi:hypothetical protein
VSQLQPRSLQIDIIDSQSQHLSTAQVGRDQQKRAECRRVAAFCLAQRCSGEAGHLVRVGSPRRGADESSGLYADKGILGDIPSLQHPAIKAADVPQDCAAGARCVTATDAARAWMCEASQFPRV